MKTILVPTDFSGFASDALNFAIELSKKMSAKIHVLHVIEQPAYDNFDAFADGYGGSGMDDTFMIKLIEKSKKDLKDIQDKYADSDISIGLKITKSIQTEIVDYSLKIKADLIIMGSKGTNTIDEEIVGSNTEKIVRISHCPVLTIKEKCDADISNIVFASDFKEVNEKVVNKVKFYQELFGAKLHLLRVCTPHNFENSKIIESQMHGMAEKYKLSNYITHMYNDFYEEDGIANFTSHHDFDLICLATSGRTGMSHFFTGSIAEDVVNHSYKPVMTFNLKTIDK